LIATKDDSPLAIDNIKRELLTFLTQLKIQKSKKPKNPCPQKVNHMSLKFVMRSVAFGEVTTLFAEKLAGKGKYV
jgi:hypothetical protein